MARWRPAMHGGGQAMGEEDVEEDTLYYRVPINRTVNPDLPRRWSQSLFSKASCGGCHISHPRQRHLIRSRRSRTRGGLLDVRLSLSAGNDGTATAVSTGRRCNRCHRRDVRSRSPQRLLVERRVSSHHSVTPNRQGAVCMSCNHGHKWIAKRYRGYSSLVTTCHTIKSAASG